jgi:hypothetical protein
MFLLFKVDHRAIVGLGQEHKEFRSDETVILSFIVKEKQTFTLLFFGEYICAQA